MFVSTGQEVKSSSSESPQLCRRFKFSEIQLATQNLDESLVIGRGGFGKVYKGTITNGPNFLTAAIKRLDSNSNQGASEFWAEVNMLSNLRHCHLVSLIGYCNDGKEMILVYEYMSNGTLEYHLHRRHTPLSWIQRLKICIGAARGLDYLHTGTGINHGVVHRDVKSSNILLDESWAAKVSDFGLSKRCSKDQLSSCVNTMIKGTFGYLDPDYFYTGRLTRKSDVYAFGVVLFEVLCGKRAVDSSMDEEQWGLAVWAQESIKGGRLKQIVDSNIRAKIYSKCLKVFAQLAKRCLHKNPKQRPTMAEVVVGLESILASQAKANNIPQPTRMQLFAKKALTATFYRFYFDTINVATENFSEANIILQVKTYESVYKGKLQNGQGIAVARIYIDGALERFMNEASILLKLEHENLAKLLGYCSKGTSLFLVYDFTLHEMFDPVHTLVNWDKRYKIILGVARALLYLHKEAPIRMIHCNVKPGNILLDENMNPLLSGFLDTRYSDIYMTTCIPPMFFETGHYEAPEYMGCANVSTKTDVYSLGVLVLETVTGSRMFNYMLLLELVERCLLEGTISNIVDPRIDIDSCSVTRFMEIGLLCVQKDANKRPTMEEVVSMLIDSLPLTLPVDDHNYNTGTEDYDMIMMLKTMNMILMQLKSSYHDENVSNYTPNY